ncbi:MAG TPA: urate hydroxylase PuuD, partial [Kofleriaceae bacterium]|nr:urate hydroxylase PuuD [Kofleriaceae bacterium]
MRLNELLDVVFRWAHLIAGIMWIGNSMLFNWLDRNLEHHGQLAPLSQGKIFMVHSGAFYDVEKKLLAPGELPTTLHWFKWQNGFTWLTGISLLVIVYYANGAAFLVDPNVRALDPSVAITMSVSSLLTGWIIYDGLWRTVGERHPRAATAASIVLLVGEILFFTLMFSGRAAYIQVGVLTGTIMTGNVWLCILPSQRSLIAATRAGQPQDAVLSLRAKQRSIHNNYLTFPLLFLMLSNHFPSAYGHHLNWLVLIAVMVGGGGVRHFMNIRYRGEGRQMIPIAWLTPAAIMAAIAVVGLLVITRIAAPPEVAVNHPVDFARAQEIIVKRCVPCHATHPVDPAFPA